MHRGDIFIAAALIVAAIANRDEYWCVMVLAWVAIIAGYVLP